MIGIFNQFENIPGISFTLLNLFSLLVFFSNLFNHELEKVNLELLPR